MASVLQAFPQEDHHRVKTRGTTPMKPSRARWDCPPRALQGSSWRPRPSFYTLGTGTQAQLARSKKCPAWEDTSRGHRISRPAFEAVSAIALTGGACVDRGVSTPPFPRLLPSWLPEREGCLSARGTPAAVYGERRHPLVKGSPRKGHGPITRSDGVRRADRDEACADLSGRGGLLRRSPSRDRSGALNNKGRASNYCQPRRNRRTGRGTPHENWLQFRPSGGQRGRAVREESGTTLQPHVGRMPGCRKRQASSTDGRPVDLHAHPPN